jgi:hypothetical protein
MDIVNIQIKILQNEQVNNIIFKVVIKNIIKNYRVEKSIVLIHPE